MVTKDRRPWSTGVVGLVAIALAAAGCGAETGVADTDAVTSLTPTPVPSTVAPTPPTSDHSPGSSTTLPLSDTTLPGEPFPVGPVAGAVLGVVGVAHDDVLNVRATPGIAGTIVATLDPLAEDVVAMGRARSLPQSIWYEIQTPNEVGWVNATYVAFLGLTDDATSEIVGDLGEIPTADSMLELGEMVAKVAASTDPPSRITLVVAPSVGDLGEVTYDVIGLGDDSVVGVRLHVFGQTDQSTTGFSLHSVERTALCGRGVADDGLCV